MMSDHPKKYIATVKQIENLKPRAARYELANRMLARGAVTGLIPSLLTPAVASFGATVTITTGAMAVLNPPAGENEPVACCTF